jgi:hypothetical protein
MGNNVLYDFNNFCGCKENGESEKSKLEKVSIIILNNNNKYL